MRYPFSIMRHRWHMRPLNRKDDKETIEKRLYSSSINSDMCKDFGKPTAAAKETGSMNSQYSKFGIISCLKNRK